MRPDYSYQIPLIKETFENLIKHKIALLAACPGAGKTNMAIEIMKLYLEKFPKRSVLVLAHNQKILQFQFEERLMKEGLSNRNILVTIPTAIRHMTGIRKFDFLVCDEAHHYYSKNMVQNIIEKFKIEDQLLLTGTPSKFLEKELTVTGISLCSLIQKGILNSPEIHIEKAELNISYKDYNVKTRSIDPLKRLPSSWVANAIKSSLKKALDFSKTMVICRNQNDAKEAFKFLKSKGKTFISISDIKSDSQEFQKFKLEGQFLIVVGRGILGFDFSELSSVIDLSLTLHIDRTFQALCRVVRKSIKHKSFIKICSSKCIDETYFMMFQTMDLATDQGYLRKVNYKSSYVPPEFKEGSKRNSFVDSNEILSFSNLSFSTHIVMNFSDLRKTGLLTLEHCTAVAKTCKNRLEFRKKHPSEFNFFNKTKRFRHLLYEVFGTERFLWNEQKAKELIDRFSKVKDLQAIPRGKSCATWAYKKAPHLMEKFSRKVPYFDLSEDELVKYIKKQKYNGRLDAHKKNGALTSYLASRKIRVKIFNRVFGPMSIPTTLISEKEAFKRAKIFKSRKDLDNHDKQLAKKIRSDYPHLMQKLYGDKRIPNKKIINE